MDEMGMIQTLKRYSYNIDELLNIEIERLYSSSSEEKRIQITEFFNTKHELHMPNEWESLTLKNGSEREIIALAKYSRFVGKDLEEVMTQKGGLVKYALYENEEFLGIGRCFDEVQIKLFSNASFIEKLALVRNPNINLAVIKNIFDPTANIFIFTHEQRCSLVVAFLQNKAHRNKFEQMKKDYNELWDVYLKILDYTEHMEFARLIGGHVLYHHFPCGNKYLVDIYHKLKKYSDKSESYEYERINLFKIKIASLPLARRKVLISLLKEALDDPNEEIRNIAESLLPDNDGLQNNFFKIVKKIAGTGWFIIEIIIKFVVLFAIFSAANSKVETISLSLLLIIFLHFQMMGRTHGVITIEAYKRFGRAFNHLRKLLNDSIPNEEQEEEKSFEEKTKLDWKFYVGFFFDFIFYMIAIFNLLRVSMFSS